MNETNISEDNLKLVKREVKSREAKKIVQTMIDDASVFGEIDIEDYSDFVEYKEIRATCVELGLAEVSK